MKTIKDLRETLFETIAAVRDEKNPMSVDKANAIAGLAREITSSMKMELDFRKQMGIKGGSEFLPDAVPPAHPRLATPVPVSRVEKKGGYEGKLQGRPDALRDID
jgi:hypothetical protein